MGAAGAKARVGNKGVVLGVEDKWAKQNCTGVEPWVLAGAGR